MRSDDALLLDMLLAAEKIVKFTKDIAETEFEDNELVQSAVMREIQVIGEAARMMSDQTKEKHSAIEWQQISGMRNRIIHEYFAIRLDIVWQAIITDIPTLITTLREIIPPDDD